MILHFSEPPTARRVLSHTIVVLGIASVQQFHVSFALTRSKVSSVCVDVQIDNHK